jgi:hypothetical protein
MGQVEEKGDLLSLLINRNQEGSTDERTHLISLFLTITKVKVKLPL